VLNLYPCLAKGERLIPSLQQTGRMMTHYLASEGTPLPTNKRDFVNVGIIWMEMDHARLSIIAQAASGGTTTRNHQSKVFYMADPHYPDSHHRLHYGHIEAKSVRIRWRAGVPWVWPSYAYQEECYGSYHALRTWTRNTRVLVDSFRPIVNALFRGERPHFKRNVKMDRAVWLGDELAECMAKIGMAEFFLACSEWEEILQTD